MGQITIRTFQNKDLNQVANIVAWSFKDKFLRLTSLPIENIPDFLLKVGVIYSFPFEGYIVAEENDEIVGVIVLEWLNQNRPPEKHKLSEATKYGWWKVIKLLFGLWLLMSKPKKGECYIEHIAVKSSSQGKGIGTKLLNYGMEIAKQEGFVKYTLFVSSKNLGAVKLYEKLGFKIEKVVKSYLTKRLFDIEEWYYMCQNL